jgi:Fe-S-cluster-containing dehydrogenase component
VVGFVVVCALATLTASEDSPPAGIEGQEPRPLIAVAPPPLSEETFPCSDCHEPDDINREQRELEDVHEDIVFTHDAQNRWCLDCHDAVNRDKLHLADGRLLDFTESHRLCGQCHGTKLRDWKIGLHGKRTGQWAGAKQYLLCVHCHDAHSPKFKPLKPKPPPVRPAYIWKYMEQHREDSGTEPTACSRRAFLKNAGVAAAAAAAAGCGASPGRSAFIAAMLQKNFREMSKEDVQRMLTRLESEYRRSYGQDVHVSVTPAAEGVTFAYALDISLCIGCRRCVYACVEENNQSRDPQIHWIRVLQMEKDEGVSTRHATAYYDPETVPQPGKFYFPTACQQCDNPPCVKACPVGATWKEPDGIVAIDYNWCVGCRCCVTACPYGARHFNWATPQIPADELNPETEYLGNRPRPKGVVEKCTFCLQRVRKQDGSYPACVEICPVGARKFGNLLDPESEVRRVLARKRVFRLKVEANTYPKFFYYVD